jgi:hypothetical protein
MQRFVTWKWHDPLHHAVGSLRSCRILQVGDGKIGTDHGFSPQKLPPADDHFSLKVASAMKKRGWTADERYPEGRAEGEQIISV